MAFTAGSALLEAIVLTVAAREEQGTYGYKITQEVKQVLDISESTLYPILHRLKKDGCLTVYDAPHNGRNRRYYRVTEEGRARMEAYRAEWKTYSDKINELFWGDDQ